MCLLRTALLSRVTDSEYTYTVQLHQFAGVILSHAMIGDNDKVDTVLHSSLLQTIK